MCTANTQKQVYVPHARPCMRRHESSWTSKRSILAEGGSSDSLGNVLRLHSYIPAPPKGWLLDGKNIFRGVYKPPFGWFHSSDTYHLHGEVGIFRSSDRPGSTIWSPWSCRTGHGRIYRTQRCLGSNATNGAPGIATNGARTLRTGLLTLLLGARMLLVAKGIATRNLLGLMMSVFMQPE